MREDYKEQKVSHKKLKKVNSNTSSQRQLKRNKHVASDKSLKKSHLASDKTLKKSHVASDKSQKKSHLASDKSLKKNTEKLKSNESSDNNPKIA